MNDLQRAGDSFRNRQRACLDRLIALAERAQQGCQYSEEDHLVFMTLCFLSKQLDHAKSVRTLGHSRDAILVCRSMIEGLCQLTWAAREPKERPLSWRAFAWVSDWRLMKLNTARGIPPARDRRAATEAALAKYGDRFLTAKARATAREGKSLPDDPYQRDWKSGETVMKNAVGMTQVLIRDIPG